MPAWGYVDEELVEIDKVAIDQDKDGYYIKTLPL